MYPLAGCPGWFTNATPPHLQTDEDQFVVHCYGSEGLSPSAEGGAIAGAGTAAKFKALRIHTDNGSSESRAARFHVIISRLRTRISSRTA
jgi:transposase InsO family protein